MQRYTYIIIVICISCVCGQELLQNPGFEEPLDGDDWFCKGDCDLTQDNDAHTGVYSGRVSNRKKLWNVVSQNVDLSANSTYFFECWVKPLNISSGQLYQKGQLMVHMKSETKSEQFRIANQPYMTPERGWQLMSGDFYIGPEELTHTRMYVRFKEIDVDYLVDTASLTKLIPNENWKSEANARIEQLRKEDITLNVDISEDYTLEDISIEVSLKKHQFGFGSAARAAQMIGTDEDSLKYRECYFENFQWAVFHNAHKWRPMEWRQGEIDYPDEAVAALREKGYTMRGHCLFWGKESAIPNWVQPLNADDMKEAMLTRINYTVPKYRGKVSQWDVCNEQLHVDYFEQKTGDIDFLTKLFKLVHEYDEDAMLFLNDFSVVRSGTSTRAMANSAQHLLSQDAPLHGIGVQSHLRGSINLDVLTAMQKRLEVVGSIGLPVWITELDISEITDPTEKADAYDDVITLYFSDPNIEGIILWGFSDLHHGDNPDASLFEGSDYTPNESGLRWQELLNTRWQTSANYAPNSHQETFTLRGFKGNYILKVSEQDNLILEIEFDLENQETTVDIVVE